VKNKEQTRTGNNRTRENNRTVTGNRNSNRKIPANNKIETSKTEKQKIKGTSKILIEPISANRKTNRTDRTKPNHRTKNHVNKDNSSGIRNVHRKIKILKINANNKTEQETRNAKNRTRKPKNNGMSRKETKKPSVTRKTKNRNNKEDNRINRKDKANLHQTRTAHKNKNARNK